MDVNSLPKTVTRQRRGCDLNPGPSAPESSTLTIPLPSHPTASQPIPIYAACWQKRRVHEQDVSGCCLQVEPELSMGWVDPWVGLRRVGSVS